MNAKITIKSFRPGQEACEVLIRPRYEKDPNASEEYSAYDAYIQTVRIKSVGRKFVTTDRGRKFKLCETVGTNWLIEADTIYSPEKKLFASRDDAVDHIIRSELVKEIREKAYKIASILPNTITTKKLRDLSESIDDILGREGKTP